MGAPNRTIAALTRAFATRKGKTARTAYLARQNNTPEWQAFVEEQTSRGPKESEHHREEPTKPDFADMPEKELENPQLAVKWTWELYRSSKEQWDRAGDGESAEGFASATLKAQDAYFKAKSHLERWEIHQREVISMSEYQQLVPFFDGLVALIRSCPSEIALNANPASPSTARSAIEAWLVNRFEPAARALAEQLP